MDIEQFINAFENFKNWNGKVIVKINKSDAKHSEHLCITADQYIIDHEKIVFLKDQKIVADCKIENITGLIAGG